MLLEQSQDSYHLRWEPLIVMAGEENLFRRLYSEVNAENVFEFLAFRQDNPSSIIQCIAKARENARTIRDCMSREMWEDINGLYHMVGRFNPREEIVAGPHRFCDKIKFATHRFHGVTDATLPRDEGWQFLRIGWSLERSEMTSRLVDVQYQNLLDELPTTGTPDNHQWMAVLRSVGAVEAYHRHYHCLIEPEKVAGMLILNPQHPRSIRFSTTEVQAGLRAISGSERGSYANEAERLAGRIVERLSYDKIEEIFKQGLHSYLNELSGMFSSIGSDIARNYFYYAVGA
jgi:uncharacterized alpha-E superfamily protein